MKRRQGGENEEETGEENEEETGGRERRGDRERE